MAIEYGESDLRVRYEKYRRILDNLTIMDDIFMRNVLNQPACTEYLLQIIMQNEELKLLDCMVQKDFKNLQGRSVYMMVCQNILSYLLHGRMYWEAGCKYIMRTESFGKPEKIFLTIHTLSM